MFSVAQLGDDERLFAVALLLEKLKAWMRQQGGSDTVRAVLLLDDAAGWSAQYIQAAIATGETRTLSLKRQVPVLILYFTAEADGEGGVRFSPDLYGRDAGVLAGLRAPFRFAPVDRRRAR